MPEIDPGYLCHHLTLDEGTKPVIQRRRKFNEEKCLIIREETQKLLTTSHIREIQYPEWLANVVLVKKASGIGKCVWISPTSIRSAPKILTHYRI